MGGGLVIHAPGAANKFESSLLHQHLNCLLDLGLLLLPPLEEEGRFHIDETLLGIPEQSLHHRIDYVLDSSLLDLGLAAIVVLVDGLQPAHIVMCVGHQVHVQHVGFGWMAALKNQNWKYLYLFFLDLLNPLYLAIQNFYSELKTESAGIMYIPYVFILYTSNQFHSYFKLNL